MLEFNDNLNSIALDGEAQIAVDFFHAVMSGVVAIEYKIIHYHREYHVRRSSHCLFAVTEPTTSDDKKRFCLKFISLDWLTRPNASDGPISK